MADATIDVRAENAFDVAALHAWLAVTEPTLLSDRAALPEVRQFPGGASNLTFLLRYPDRELVLRMPPAGHKAASAHDMRREVTVQTHLRPRYPLVPRIVGFCDDPTVLGGDFYVMERIDGTILRSDLPAGVDLDAMQVRKLAHTVIDAQADLFSIDPLEVGLADLGRGPGYPERQVLGWSRRYRDALTDDVPDGEDVMSWLAARIPTDAAQCLIHGDWRFDNLVLDLDAPRVVGVLDWEMATIGDPLMDLGASLAYWVTADDDPAMLALRRQPTHLAGMPTRQEYVERYLSRTGLAVDEWTFYEVFGLFRLAVIIQQIWYRYRLGETTNPAFADFGVAVDVLIGRARAVAGR